MTPEQLHARSEAIRRAWDDPLRRALMSAKKTRGGKYSSVEAYNAYYREYRRRKKNDSSGSGSD
jgi:hypothetical protein